MCNIYWIKNVDFCLIVWYNLVKMKGNRALSNKYIKERKKNMYNDKISMFKGWGSDLVALGFSEVVANKKYEIVKMSEDGKSRSIQTADCVDKSNRNYCIYRVSEIIEQKKIYRVVYYNTYYSEEGREMVGGCEYYNNRKYTKRETAEKVAETVPFKSCTIVKVVEEWG